MAHQVYEIGRTLTKAEMQARRAMLHSIRLAFILREPSAAETMSKAADAFKPYLEPGVFSDAYGALSVGQRAAVREAVLQPALRAFNNGKEMWVEANLDLLGRLERGEDVGPVQEDAGC